MEFKELYSKLDEQATSLDPIGATVKFKIDDKVVHVDGTGSQNIITLEDKEADCVISTTMDTFQKLKSGKMNGTMAVMMGKVKIKGDLSIAMKLQSLLG